MKKLLLALSALLFITGCKVESTASYKTNDLVINGVTYEKTGEVLVLDKEITIEGDLDKGAFKTGTSITLKPFYIGKYEVTQELYKAVMENAEVLYDGEVYKLKSEPSYFSNNELLRKDEVQKLCPVETISWYDALYFCNRLSELSHLENVYNIENIEVNSDGRIYKADVSLNENTNGYRLPFEKEWEFAARGGNNSKPEWNYCFSGSDSIEWIYSTNQQTDSANKGLDLVGWYIHNICTDSGTTELNSCSPDKIGVGTHEVGRKNSNTLELFDMSGNVSEWCFDEGGEFMRIIKGGGYNNFALSCQCTSIQYQYRYYNDRRLGLRLCRSYIPEN